MDNYLKGRQSHNPSQSDKLEKLKAIKNTVSALPAKDIKHVEVVSGPGQPQVECVTQDGKVTRILITCRCGEQIELICHYGA